MHGEHKVKFRTMLIFYDAELLAHRRTPSWTITPLRLFATAYWIHMQLPSVSGGRLFHPQREDVSRRGDRDPLNR
jgi:hypothetical protein